jgi:outer membrane protein TolC
LSDIFTWQSKALQVGGSFVVPILNYGRIANQIRVEDASFQGAVLNYQNTVLQAQAEVENGLSAFTSARRAMQLLNQASETAGKSADLALNRYQQGQNDYSIVLTAQQQQLQIADSAVSARGSAILALISVYRALGGGWEIRAGGDVISPEVKAEMARRTNWGKMLEPGGHLPEAAPPSTAALQKEEAQP